MEKITKELIKADIHDKLKRIERAKLRQKKAQTTIDTLNRQINDKRRMLK